MPDSTRKSRTISLRLSEQEFEALKSIHAERGLRSLSEFVRGAMHRVLSEKTEEKFDLETKVQEIDGKLSLLDGEVARLSRLLVGRMGQLKDGRDGNQ